LIEKIYNNKLKDYIDNIKKDINKIFEEIHSLINYENLGVFNYYVKNNNPGSNNIVNKLIDSTINELDRTVELFFVKINSVYSQEAINEVLYTRQNDLFGTIKLKADFENFLTVISENIESLSSLVYKRFVEEKTLFQQNIKIFFELAFKNKFSEFAVESGRNYLNNAIYSDYEKRIYPDFNLMKSAVNDTYYFVQALIDTAELKGVGDTLAKSFISAFSDTKEEIQAIIPSKIENVIWTKIELFKDETQEKISNLFINNLENEINKIGSKLNSKIYDLVPKQLEIPFKAIIEGIYRENVNISIEEIKQLYKTLVNSDLSLLLNDLSNKDNEISQNISALVITKPPVEWTELRNIYNNLTSKTKSYNDKIKFDVPKENENSILNLLKYIKPYLINITVGFYEQVKIGQNNLNIALSNYNNITIYSTAIIGITDDMNEQIVKTNTTINNLFKELQEKVVNSFTKLETQFKNITNDIVFEGFYEKKRNRNLMEYDLSEKKKIYDKIEEKYKNFTYNITTLNTYYDINTKKEGLMNSLSNSAKILTKDFYIYKHLIEQYTDNEKINEYFEKLALSSELIKKKILKFVLETSTNVDTTLESVNKTIQNSFDNTKQQIDSYIDSLLNEIFKKKLEALYDLNGRVESPNIITYSYHPLTVEYINSDNQIENTLDIYIDINNVYVGYNLSKLNEYDFKMNVYAGGDVNLTAENSVNKQVVEILKGNLATGEVGIEANYSLHEMSVDIDAYTKLNDVNYVVEAETIEEYMKIYNGDRFVPGKELHTSRNFSATHYDVVE